MKLEQQVVSLELAQKLKELGVKQEGNYMWGNFSSQWGLMFREKQGDNFDYWLKSGYFPIAFTVAELGELLNEITTKIDCGDSWYDKVGQTAKPTVGWGGDLHEETSDTEADARAKMLVYLLENNLLY